MTRGLKSELKILSKHSTIYGISTFLNRIVAFFLLPLYTHYLTPSDYGVLDLLYLTTAYIGMTMEMGITSAMSRFYFDSDDQKDRNLIVSTTLYGFGIGTTLLLLFFIGGSSLLSKLVFQDAKYTYFMILALIGLGLDMYIRVGYTYIRIRQRSSTLLYISLFRLLMQIGLNVLLLVVFKLGIVAMLWGTIISYLVLAPYLVIYVVRETGFGFSWKRLKEMIKFGLPLVPSDILGYIVNTSDRYFLNFFHNLTLTGLYCTGYRFGILINRFVVNPFGQIWMPRRFEMHKREDSDKIFGRIFTYFCLLLCFGGLYLSVLTKDVLQLVTEKSYWGAYVVVPILVLSYIVDSFRLHFNIGILIKKKTKLFLLINLATAALNLVLNYFLIKEFHMWGAAWATLLAFIFRSSVTFYLSNRMVKIELETWRLMKAFAVAGLMYWPISMIETGQPLLNLAVKSVVCLAYPVVLLSIGLFEPKEIAKAKEYSRALYQKLLKKFRRKERSRKYQDESVERNIDKS